MRADYGNNELNMLIESLRPKLPDYLKEHGVLPDGWTEEGNQKFKCLNPAHDDHSPSMQFVPGTENSIAKCWSCHAKVDIFKAATWLDGKPDSGKEWINENVYELARHFNVEFVEYQPTPEELAKAKVLEMLNDAADCLVGLCLNSPDIGYKYTRERSLTDETSQKMGIGSVNWDKFVHTMRQYGGWEKEYMEAHGVTNRVFGEEFITITLRDYKGMVIGFDRRFALYDREAEAECRKVGKGESYPKKWYLPHKSEIFDPSKFLYGLHLARNNSHNQLDIVEGYFDALSGMQAGHKSIVACCGTSGLSSSQMDLLVELGFQEICIVFDSDKAGRDGMKRYLKEFAGDRRFRLKFKFLEFGENSPVPEKDRDPDTFFKMFCKNGLEPYSSVNVISAFSLAMQLQKQDGKGGEELAKAQIPHLAAESDPLIRGKQVRELAEATGVNEFDIRLAVDHIISGKAKNIARDLIKEIQRGEINLSPSDLTAILRRAETKLSPLFGGSSFSVNTNAARQNYNSALDFFDNDRGAISGYRTGIRAVDEELGGVQKSMFWVVAGNPNSGKSAFVHQVINGIVRNYKENKDVCVLFFSFDDTVQWSWAKQLAIYSGLPIKHIARPTVYIKDPADARKYNEARAFFRERVGDNIRIFGGDIGMNIEQIRKAIRDVQDATGGRHCLVVVDSFNKMHGIDNIEGHEKFARNADELHQLVHDGMTVICTAETVKAAQGRKPTMGDLADTKKLSFDCNVGTIVYNPLHEERDNATYFHMRQDEKGWRKAAVVQLDFVKNKITDYKGNMVLKFNDHIGSFEEIPDIRAFMEIQNRLFRQHGMNNSIAKPLYENDSDSSSEDGSSLAPSTRGKGFGFEIGGIKADMFGSMIKSSPVPAPVVTKSDEKSDPEVY